MKIKLNVSKILVGILVLFSVGAQALVTDSVHPAGSIEHSGNGGSLYEKAKEKVQSYWTKMVSFFDRSLDRSPASDQTVKQPAVVLSPETITKVVPSSVEVVQAKESQKKFAVSIKQFNPVKVSKKGVEGDKKLLRTKSGIPYLNTKQLEALKRKAIVVIPLLGVGREDELESAQYKFEGYQPFLEAKVKKVDELPTTPTISESQFQSWLGEKLELAKAAEVIPIPILEEDKKVTHEKIDKLVYQLAAEIPVTELLIVAFDEEDLKLLRGLILYAKKDLCHQAAGIFSALTGSKKEETRQLANHHLGVCLHEMNLPTEALHYLGKTVKQSNDAEFTKQAFEAIIEDYKLRNEEQVAQGVQAYGAKVGNTPLAHYLISKYQLRKGDYNNALQHALKVGEKDKNYNRAQYVAAVAEYFLGKATDSLGRQKTLVDVLKRTGQDKELFGLAQLNLGRMMFQKARFKDAIDSYQQIPKEHPLWIQGLVELGWAQLQSKDAAGAIGNMHSIQSPYFEAVYKPDSFVVRSIGYLDICQYGDAFRTVGFFQQKYDPWYSKILKYQASAKSMGPNLYSATVKYLGNMKLTSDVEGLPYQVIREMARQKDFLNAQEAVNEIIDEGEGYSFIQNLIDKDRKNLNFKRAQVVKKANDLKLSLQKAQKKNELAKNINPWKAELKSNLEFADIFSFKLEVLAESENDFKLLRRSALERLAQDKSEWKLKAGDHLKRHFKSLATSLERQLANNEFLRYEVYSGSGENLRAQMAGSGDPAAASKKYVPGQKVKYTPKIAAKEKNKWEFDGEFWEDEIGNYRSSLKNNCPNQHVARE